jgi:formamidopyrimidine-DNA glycosylase
MPELPEVETVRIGLQRLLPGRIVSAVDADNPKSFPNTEADVQAFLIGAKIQQARRRAKVLLIDLSTHYTLMCHLKMTGQMVFVRQKPVLSSEFRVPGQAAQNPEPRTQNNESEIRFGAGHPNDGLVAELPNKATRVTLTFTDDSRLFFNDFRKFGWMRLIPTIQVPELDFFKKVGPEPLAGDFTDKDFIQRLQRRKNTAIKAALLDQTVLAGVGNIYADESLWGAKIHPATRVSQVPPAKLKLLFKELRYVLQLAIEKGGSTDKNYVNAEGKRGSYLSFARVFRREGQDCSRHPGTAIIKSRVAGRGTHTCPRCQKL